MIHPGILVAFQAAAFWPVWPWLAGRFRDPGAEEWSWIPLLALAVTLARAAPPADAPPPDLRLPAALTAAYALAVHSCPPLVRAALALLALGSTLGALRLRSPAHPALGALVLLALPALPSLQYLLGYPLRVASGTLAAGLLACSGLPVSRQGTCLALDGRLLAIDAPCSGVRMLWAALLLAALLALSRGLAARRAGALLALALVGTVIANGVRTAGLFLVESGLVPAPAPAHDAVGLSCFAALAVALVLAAWRLERP